MAQRHIVAGSAGLTAGRNAPAGYATDDGVAIHYVDTELHRIVADTPGRAAYRVCLGERGELLEQRLAADLLD
jgi:peptidase E